MTEPQDPTGYCAVCGAVVRGLPHLPGHRFYGLIELEKHGNPSFPAYPRCIGSEMSVQPIPEEAAP
jgi:hypothetical protein